MTTRCGSHCILLGWWCVCWRMATSFVAYEPTKRQCWSTQANDELFKHTFCAKLWNEKFYVINQRCEREAREEAGGGRFAYCAAFFNILCFFFFESHNLSDQSKCANITTYEIFEMATEETHGAHGLWSMCVARGRVMPFLGEHISFFCLSSYYRIDHKICRCQIGLSLEALSLATLKTDLGSPQPRNEKKKTQIAFQPFSIIPQIANLLTIEIKSDSVVDNYMKTRGGQSSYKNGKSYITFLWLASWFVFFLVRSLRILVVAIGKYRIEPYVEIIFVWPIGQFSFQTSMRKLKSK